MMSLLALSWAALITHPGSGYANWLFPFITERHCEISDPWSVNILICLGCLCLHHRLRSPQAQKRKKKSKLSLSPLDSFIIPLCILRWVFCLLRWRIHSGWKLRLRDDKLMKRSLLLLPTSFPRSHPPHPPSILHFTLVFSAINPTVACTPHDRMPSSGCKQAPNCVSVPHNLVM